MGPWRAFRNHVARRVRITARSSMPASAGPAGKWPRKRLPPSAAGPLAQLVKWYDDGWQWYGVRCRFDTLGDEYEASLWGIDDAEYAERDIKVEMALDVAAQLEKAGFTVTGKPEHGPGFQGLSRADKQEHIRRNLAAQNWAA